MTPFDFVNSINSGKQNLMRNTENDELAEKSYVAFIVNRALSYFPDTILYANEINQHPEIDGIMQYEYLLNSVRPGKRFSKWAKSNTTDEVTAISKLYKVNMKKAQEYHSLLSHEQIQEVVAVINNS